MMPINAKITKIVDETPSIKTFFLDLTLDNKPGQFVMVWIREVDEIPMSPSYSNAITVQKVGDATSALFKLKKGDSVGIRGPIGNGFTLSGKSILLIAGGVGAAPLAPLVEVAGGKKIKVKTLLGAKTASELLFVKRFRSAGDLQTATDDGSDGHKGPVTELLDELDLRGYDQIYSCGPEKMMSRVLEMVKGANMASKTQFSLQRYIKCGMGICGTCSIDPSGLRVCVDGPVFSGETLIDSEFGRYARDASGRKVRL
ncbi:MAG: dihydroorotate dehydrogenase electron transfer subunit [Methanocellales archaeon]|nr:dihydroorotate dehydrogenase electron transfer subunit [Methanocellales archaeon]